jgi:predicted RNase H-like HicB family nuclease
MTMKKHAYTVIFERGPTSWGAYVPDLPGCVAVGKTEAEVRRLIKEAIELHLESLQAATGHIPKAMSRAERIPVYA